MDQEENLEREKTHKSISVDSYVLATERNSN